MGKGPPYTRIDNNSRSNGPTLKLSRVLDTMPARDANKLVLVREDRIHYALGLLSVVEDIEKLDLD
jgi:hypothetical protein